MLNTNNEQKLLADIHRNLDQGNYTEAAAICDFLIEKNCNVEAMFIRSHFGLPDESEETFNARRISLLKKAADIGHVSAIYELSIHLEEGDIVAQDKAKALHLLQHAADLGHPHATWRAGLMLIYAQPGKDVKKGLALVEKAAQLKSQGALRTLAEFYSKGQFGYPIDPDKANNLILSAEEGDAIPL
jgi:TPR repeat protein